MFSSLPSWPLLAGSFLATLSIVLAPSALVADRGPTPTPGQIPAGTQCTANGPCPNTGTKAERSTIEFQGEQDCGGPASTQIAYGDASVTFAGSPGPICPLIGIYRPSCGASVAKPGCCIISSQNLPERLLNFECNCLERRLGFLWCVRFDCQAKVSDATLSYARDCMSAGACAGEGSTDSCNQVTIQSPPTPSSP